jgi:hypothetical protein
MNTCRSRGSLFGAVPLLLIALAVAGCGRTATLYQPPRVAFFPMDTTAVEHAIITGMVKRRWVASREGPGSILGTLHLRDHTVVVRITYTNDSYQIAYVSSENMKYSRKADGTEIIHKNYNSWIDNLTRDIDAELIPPAR